MIGLDGGDDDDLMRSELDKIDSKLFSIGPFLSSILLNLKFRIPNFIQFQIPKLAGGFIGGIPGLFRIRIPIPGYLAFSGKEHLCLGFQLLTQRRGVRGSGGAKGAGNCCG